MGIRPRLYQFRTVWDIPAPVSAVWEVISHPEQWPAWWKGVEAVAELEPGDADGIGSVHLYTWKSLLPYRLTFHVRLQEKQPCRYLKGAAFGELRGTGEWFFEATAQGTRLVCLWNVTTEKAWMNVFAFLLRPLFSYNHRLVMRWGEQCLKDKLAYLRPGGTS